MYSVQYYNMCIMNSYTPVITYSTCTYNDVLYSKLYTVQIQVVLITVIGTVQYSYPMHQSNIHLLSGLKRHLPCPKCLMT
jgi:hypothetical protein